MTSSDLDRRRTQILQHAYNDAPHQVLAHAAVGLAYSCMFRVMFFFSPFLFDLACAVFGGLVGLSS